MSRKTLSSASGVVASGFSLAAYYLISWQLLMILTATLVLSAQAVRLVVVMPSFLVGFACLTPVGRRLAAHQRLLTIAIGCALLGLGFYHAARIHQLEDVVQGMMEMICGALPLLLLNHHQPRSYWLAVLTVTVLGVGSMTFGSSLSVYLLFFVQLGLLLLNMNAANLQLPDGHQGRQAEVLPRGYFTQFFLVMPAGAMAAAAIFVTFPRVQSFTLALTRGLQGHRTGYSGLVSLSGGGELAVSESLAMVVEASDRPWLRQTYASMLMRGEALDTFDGVHWTSSQTTLASTERAQDLRTATRHGSVVHLMTIHLEPMSDATLFYPGVLLSVGLPQGTAGRFLFSGNGTLMRQADQGQRFRYQVRALPALAASELPTVPLAALAAAMATGGAGSNLASDDWQRHLAIPEQVRQAPYFQTWLNEVAIDPRRSSLSAAEERLKSLFAAKFTATLANSFDQGEALAAFLGPQRRGHCEYFATAAALTLRSLGVPTRLVVGYLGGTYSPLIDAVEVRDEDAHAWVEAFVPGVGWHAFDPTPKVARGAPSGLAQLRLLVNGLSFWFHHYLVDYDQEAQRSLLRGLQLRSPLTGGGFDLAWLKEAARPLAMGVLATLALWWLGRRLRRQQAGPALPPYYRAFARRMEKAGKGRRPGETFAQYHQRLLLEMPDEPEILAIDRRLELELYARPRHV